MSSPSGSGIGSNGSSGSSSLRSTADTGFSPTSSTSTITAVPPIASPSTSSTSSSSTSATSAPASPSDPLGFVWDLKSNPCFRSSLMWGIGVGAAMGAHSFSRHKLPYKASDTAVKTFFAVSALSWLWCRHQARKEKELFDAVFDQQQAAKLRRQNAAAVTESRALHILPTTAASTANST